MSGLCNKREPFLHHPGFVDEAAAPLWLICCYSNRRRHIFYLIPPHRHPPALICTTKLMHYLDVNNVSMEHCIKCLCLTAALHIHAEPLRKLPALCYFGLWGNFLWPVQLSPVLQHYGVIIRTTLCLPSLLVAFVENRTASSISLYHAGVCICVFVCLFTNSETVRNLTLPPYSINTF